MNRRKFVKDATTGAVGLGLTQDSIGESDLESRSQSGSGLVTKVKGLINKYSDYPPNVVWNEIRREFGDKISDISKDHITFKMPERRFNVNMYDGIRELATALNLNFVPEEGGLPMCFYIKVHLKEDRTTVATLEKNEISINSTHPKADHYLGKISSLYSEPQEKEGGDVANLTEILNPIKKLEGNYPAHVVREEIDGIAREVRGHWIHNLGKFSDMNNSETWAILLGMPTIPFTTENYNNIRRISKEAGLEFEPGGNTGKKIYLKDGMTVVAMLRDDGLALNIEYPGIDKYLNLFSEKIYQEAQKQRV